MPTDGHRDALQRYQLAIDDLYAAPSEKRLAAASREEAPTPRPDEERVDAVVGASQALTKSTRALVTDDDPNVKANGQARLAALAATDIAIAFDVAQLEEEQPGAAIASAQTPASTLAAIEPEISFVFEGDPSHGVPTSPDAQMGGATLAATSGDPREALRAALPEFLGQVRDDATEIVVGGLKGAVAGETIALLGQAGAGLLHQLPTKVGLWYRKALALLKEAIKKLEGLLGDGFQKIVESAKNWFADNAPKAVANFVYKVPDLGDELQKLLDGVSTEKEWGRIEEAIGAVVQKFRSIKKVVLALFKALEFAGRWILHAIGGPVGQAVVAGVFALGSLYGLFAGGDYIDWKVTKTEGAFDFVVGIRRTAEAELN